MIIERHVSPDSMLTFVVERLDDGATLLGFEQGVWHTYPSLLDREDGTTDEAAMGAYIDRLLCGVAVVGVRRKGGAIVDARVIDHPKFEVEALAEGETLEMRHWDGRPWSPALAEESIFAEVLGGLELLQHFGEMPSFHDGEILGLHLDRDGPSTLRVHGWITTDRVGPDGTLVLERHAVVTFTIHGVMDLRLDGFSRQNVIGGLILRRAPDRPERRNYLAFDPTPDDIEIELEPCYGLDGLIRARSVAITFEPGEPGAQDA
ncbi:hypothetical protein ACQKQD_33785 [Methylobacterium sp. NPDC080182]|uniref:hypothetical protein n=1 Tax=Methylobacterium sp. NPDC080182 TaxID=3390590 RepID=UPI003D014CD8